MTMRDARLLCWLCVLALTGQASRADQPASADARRERGPAQQDVCDLIIGRDGVLRGLVFESADGRQSGKLAGLRVKLLHQGRTVATASTGRQGRFSLQNLSDGFYCLSIDSHGKPIQRFCRVWSSSSAPPVAQNEIRVFVGEPSIRAQYPSPFPIMSLRQAATVTGIAAGAIAAPVIYHNTKVDNRIPASP